MHPWYGITKISERKALKKEMKKWLEDCPLLRLHAGQVREDGKIFLTYHHCYAHGEQWVTPEYYARRLEQHRLDGAKAWRKPGHREKRLECMKKRYASSAMFRWKVSEREKKDRQEKPWLSAAKSLRHVARKLARTHPEHDDAIKIQLCKDAGKLTRETGIKHHIDHIIPLSRGGWHHHLNMQVLPGTLNHQKSANPFWQMPGYKSWRDVPEHLWPVALVEKYRARLLDKAS